MDSASRMPPAASRATRAIASSSAVGPPPRHPSELALDLRHGQRPEVEPLDARQHGRADLARVGRAEDERDVVGRLLERLQEDVPALLDALDLVDDEHLPPRGRRRRRDARQELAHVVDLVVGRRVHLDHVERAAFADRDAGLTGVVGLAVDGVVAVERLGDDPRHGRLAGAARADEEQPVRDLVEPDGVAEGLDDRFLADDLAERLRAETAVDRLVRVEAGRGWSFVTSMVGGVAPGDRRGRLPQIRWQTPNSRVECRSLRSPYLFVRTGY